MAGGAGRRVSRSSRNWSLRSRLLLLQIAVTAVFLLVLGIVSTELFSHNLTNQFKVIIRDESDRSVADINARPSPELSAALVSLSPFTVKSLSGGRPSVNHSLTAAVKKLGIRQVLRSPGKARCSPSGRLAGSTITSPPWPG